MAEVWLLAPVWKLEEVVDSVGEQVNKLDTDASKFRVSVQTDLQALKRDMQAVMGALKIEPSHGSNDA